MLNSSIVLPKNLNFSNEDLTKLNSEQLKSLYKLLYEYNLRRKADPLRYFTPQPYQEEFWKSEKKENWVLGGNRSGKTTNGAARVVELMRTVPNTDAWACTWADMSIAVQQKKIYEMLPRELLQYCKFNEATGFANRVVTFTNGSAIRFKTYDQGAESYQGTSKDIIWNDEEPPQPIYKEQKARLIDRDGLLVTTMTPINGITWVHDHIFEKLQNRDLIDFWFWDTGNNELINKEAFRKIIGMYDNKEAQVRSKGLFLNLRTGRLYFAFDRRIHMKDLKVIPDLALRLSFDFNVDPMTTSIFQIVKGDKRRKEQDKVVHLLECVNNPDFNTKMQCEVLRDKLRGWRAPIVIYGDASNPRRTETADVNDTNWKMVKKFFPESEKVIYKVPDSNPNIKERVGWVNAKFMNFDNEVGMYINSKKCSHMITDMEQGVWGKNGKEKDKKNTKLNHNSDNLDYMIAQEFPLEEEAFASVG